MINGFKFAVKSFTFVSNIGKHLFYWNFNEIVFQVRNYLYYTLVEMPATMHKHNIVYLHSKLKHMTVVRVILYYIYKNINCKILNDIRSNTKRKQDLYKVTNKP